MGSSVRYGAMNILITGSRGLIGSAVARSREMRGNTLVPLSRTPARGGFTWDPARGKISLPHNLTIDAVIHLAGENIARVRWSEKQKILIHDSRIKGTQLLIDKISKLQPRPKIVLSASGIGIFGDRGTVLLNEDDQPGEGFLAEIAREWEAATRVASRAGIRVVNLRFGAVISKEGGILKRLQPLFKCGLGTILGSGNQYMSWVTIDDVVRAIEYLLVRETIEGPVNIVTPHPVTNREFAKTLGKAVHRPVIFKLPSCAIQMFYGEMGKELLLTSTRAVPNRLTSSGFTFTFPYLEGGIRHILGETHN